MFTCYLFTNKFDDEVCLSLRLDSKGNIDESLKERSISEFQLLQKNAKTYIVISTDLSSIHELELPLLNERKARLALTYALEDELAEPVTNLHFSFSKNYYINNRYLIVVINKHVIHSLQKKLANLQIHYDVITSDWFALNFDEACYIGNNILINDGDFKGALSIDLLDHYLKMKTSSVPLNIFNDSQNLSNTKILTIDDNSYQWIASRLFTKEPMNFCQGEFKHTSNKQGAKIWYKLSTILGCIWISSLIFTNLINLLVLDNQLTQYDKKIAVLYKKFFPEAKQVISPRFRVKQLLEHNQYGYDSLFWKLLSNFSSGMYPNKHEYTKEQVIIEQIKFQNKSLLVTLTCSNFSILEQIENNLKKEQISFKKSGAATKGDKIVATLEIS